MCNFEFSFLNRNLMEQPIGQPIVIVAGGAAIREFAYMTSSNPRDAKAVVDTTARGGKTWILRSLFRSKQALFAAALIGVTTSLAANPEEAPFLAENQSAMSKMMSAMEIKPSGDVDKDFVAMMAPHHQGAIDMAKAELRYGQNEQLRRLAQEIIVTQQQEIVAMALALGQPLPPSAASPDQPSSPVSSTLQPVSPHEMHMHEEP
jgi:Domain of unknown function (DUF305)